MVKGSITAKLILFVFICIAVGFLLCGYRPVFKYFTKGPGQQVQGIKGVPADISEIRTGRVLVALTLGQSNAGNFGEIFYSPRHEVYCFYKGRLYRYKEPVPGASGTGGSVWGMLGDMLIEQNLFDKAVFVCIAKGSTSVQCWSEGMCRLILEETLKDLNRTNIKLTHVFWHQGEEDNLYNTPAVLYKLRLGKVLEILKGYGQDAPVFVSVATYNPWAKSRISSDLRKAQIEFVKENSFTFPGPDTDTLVSHADRFDGIHFSGSGMKKHLLLWFDAVTRGMK